MFANARGLITVRGGAKKRKKALRNGDVKGCAQRLRDAIQGVDRRICDSPLDSGKIGLIDSGQLRQLLLAQTLAARASATALPTIMKAAGFSSRTVSPSS